MNFDFDVVVIGSGPAGGIAAFHTATAGLKTALFEKEMLPRRKVCAGGVVRRAINLLPEDFSYPVESTCDTLELRMHNPETTFQESRDGLITMVSRVDFDYALTKHAEKHGAEIHDGTAVKSVTPFDDYVKIDTETRSYTTRYLILAEGANARISNKFWKDDRLLVTALESEVFLPEEKLREFKGVARFDFDIITSGYAWIFPKKDHINIGLGAFPQGKKTNINKVFDEYKAMNGITDAYEEKNRRGYIIPITPRKESYMKQRMLLVGDAAGFADPITAEGFTYAFKSGIEAAKAIVNGSDPSEVSKLYHEGIDLEVTQELNAVTKLSKPFYFSKRLRGVLFRRYGARMCKGMVDLLEGKRSYVGALNKHSFIARLIRSIKV